MPPTSAVRISPDSTSTTRIRTSSSTKEMKRPSGDQEGSHAMTETPRPILRGSAIPSWGARTSSYPSPSSENQATVAPSGDQMGARSAAPEERERFRVSPSSAGTVKISPRASITARTPLGEREAKDTRGLTSSQRVATQGKSPWTSMARVWRSPVTGSRSLM